MELDNIVFLDRNICIKINNCKFLDYALANVIQKYDNSKTIIFTLPSFIEATFKDKSLSDTIKEESTKIKKFFQRALIDIPQIKNNPFTKETLEDFHINHQVEFHKFLTDIIKNKPPKKCVDSVKDAIIYKVNELDLKLYFPICIAAISALYDDKARKLLKLNDSEAGVNVASDMINILIVASTGVSFQKYFSNTPKIHFVTEDKSLKEFYKNIDIVALHNLFRGKNNYSCPIKKEYFKKISDSDWLELERLFSSPLLPQS